MEKTFKEPFGLSEKQQPISEQEKRAQLILNYIEKRIIGGNKSLDKTEEAVLLIKYKEKSAEEKALELYQKIIVYMQAMNDPEIKKTKAEEKKAEEKKAEEKKAEEKKEKFKSSAINPKLISRIKILFSDPAVRELVPLTYGEARVERKVFSAGLVKDWKALEKGKKILKKKLDDLNRKLFQEEIKKDDDIEETKHTISELHEEIEENAKAQAMIENLSSYEHIAKNTDAVALIEYAKINEYNQQILSKEGFAWLPSREKNDAKAMKIIEEGDPKQTRKGIFFISESGTGKTEQIRAIAKRLTGMDHVKINCSPKTGDPQLLGKDRVFPGATKIEEGTFTDFRGTVSAAWTGYDYSYQEKPVHKNSMVVELNEMPKAFANDTFFSHLKGFFSLKDGDTMQDANKPVLPGRIIFGSGNVGAQHKNEPIPKALEREFEIIPIDYPEMSAENPELYEFMLACLIKKGVLPPVTDKELSPAYEKQNLSEDKQIKLSDGSLVVAVDELIKDSTSKKHGFLYRFAFAVKAIQNSYMASGGENPFIDYTKRDLLYSKPDDKGNEYISETGKPLMSGTTITLNEINGWMRGYLEETHKKNALTLTKWLQQKIEEKINAKYEDKEKIRAIFNYFHLLDADIDKNIIKPLTPKEIGYLSPRVSRPVYAEKPITVEAAKIQELSVVKEAEVKEYKTQQMVLEDCSSILMKICEFTLENGIYNSETKKLVPLEIVENTRFNVKTKSYIFAGVVEDEISPYNGQPIGQSVGEKDLYKIFSQEELGLAIISEFENLIGETGVDDEKENLLDYWKAEGCESTNDEFAF